ncbi:carbohydrate-binding domain-containing protein [Paracraurococcus lichenis]|uniref:Carbohydrate-binding domain-containing protein n=1 Tax=Paracraurococcus lichenis TaxID=3064888 RepID=A0ABT9E0N0_9PROT|nr:carbohydrate-binding domain-containing protein [Paracraurococcus sp. LOR1-02]MDO9709699.1 carbohydrate-binding domain-containing protein [Paracraurococcus sp. LOR1-02]
MAATSNPPVLRTIGTGADSLVLKISQDAYQGSAQYTVSVDGKQVGGTLTAGAAHAAGQDDTITVHGDFGIGAHTVTVNFLNDAFGGTAATDRNLYVDGITLNGKAVAGGNATLLAAGPVNFGFTKAATPVTTTIGTGADSLVLKVSQDAYQGSAQYTVSVDGKQVGGTLTAGASHAAAQDDTITVHGDFGVGNHTVSVNFLNDAYGGSAAADRNLYVDGVSLNGKAVAGASATLLAAGPVDLGFAKDGSVSTTIGTGADSLVLKVSQDAYQGSAQYTVSVDGHQVGGTLTAGASHAAGQDDTVTVHGDFGAGNHTVSVNFLNDAYGGSAAADRNLYVDGVSLNGKAVAGGSATLLAAGPVDFGFAKDGSVSTTIGTGADSLVLKVSQDAYQGSAQYTVSVDGHQVGGTLTAGALHAAGQDDTVTVHGSFGTGAHTVTVNFLNDAFGGTAATDRNLYVDGMTLNGKAVAGGNADLLGAGPVDFAFGDTPSGGGGDPVNGVPGNWKTVWNESFDNGSGMFSNHWGPGTDSSVPGQITVWTSADDQDSGMMTQPAGYGTPAGGWGYGLYSFTFKTEGTVGTYALLWPASNVWPGPELDLMEIDGGGTPYTTIHWKGDDGSNQFTSYSLNGVDPSKTHTYAMNWQNDFIDIYVDGNLMHHITDHVPHDYAHGGENEAPGIGTQTWWNGGAMGGNNYLTLYEASYKVLA